MVNVRGSSLDRESPAVLHLEAGREVSVASTKVVTNMQLAGLAIAAAVRDSHRHSHRDNDSGEALRGLRPYLEELPHYIAKTLAANSVIRDAATLLSTFQSIYYLGREGSLPIVREGALKLKEISYLHAEAYHAAELKHGPLALVSANHATVVVLTDDEPGTRSEVAISQTSARGGTVIVFDHRAQRRPHPDAAHVITLPSLHPLLDHILSSIALQVPSTTWQFTCAAIWTGHVISRKA
ncbi:SIS domain-containing protein [Rhodococcus sp. 14-2470-1a]|uniref:SIS domain-containing protein n=1 Tax=Rhodococcus sp. 14-2470-1a TaxID=2023150 RepID=UPI00117B2146|nr:SIS domain-containing protein [Rhodococcus sp. 14-2470-1a]